MSKIKVPALNFNLYRGDDQSILLTLKKVMKNEYGSLVTTPQDLSYIKQFDMDIKNLNGEVVGSLSSKDGSISVLEPKEGKVLMIFNHNLTKNLSASVVFYDLQAVTEQGGVETKVKGRITIESDITVRGL